MSPVEPLHPVPCLKVIRIYSLAFVSYPECPEMVYGDVLGSCWLVLPGATRMCFLCSPSLPFVLSGASTRDIHVPSITFLLWSPAWQRKPFPLREGTGTQDTVLSPHLEITRSHLGKMTLRAGDWRTFLA